MTRLLALQPVDHALSGCQLICREEPRAPFSHGEQGLTVHAAVELKAEEPSVALAEKALNANVIANGFSRPRQTVMKSHDGIQQPVNSLASRLKINPQESRQKQIRLTGLNGDARRNAVIIQIP